MNDDQRLVFTPWWCFLTEDFSTGGLGCYGDPACGTLAGFLQPHFHAGWTEHVVVGTNNRLSDLWYKTQAGDESYEILVSSTNVVKNSFTTIRRTDGVFRWIRGSNLKNSHHFWFVDDIHRLKEQLPFRDISDTISVRSDTVLKSESCEPCFKDTRHGDNKRTSHSEAREARCLVRCYGKPDGTKSIKRKSPTIYQLLSSVFISVPLLTLKLLVVYNTTIV